MVQVFELSVESDLGNLKTIRSFIKEAGTSLGVDANTVADLCLVVDEAVSNIILHGYADHVGRVDIRVASKQQDLLIRIRDQARTFDADDVETPHLDESLQDRAYGGMGVYLIKTLTDEAEFRPVPGGGNELRLLKRGVVPVK